METQQQLNIEAQCSKLINQLNWYIDAADHEAAIALFTTDCTFSRPGATVQGTDGLRAMFNSRPADRKTRHVVSNVIVDAIDADNAQGTSVCTIFLHQGTFEGEGMPPPLPVAAVVSTIGHFKRTAAGWRIAKWHTNPDFRKA